MSSCSIIRSTDVEALLAPGDQQGVGAVIGGDGDGRGTLGGAGGGLAGASGAEELFEHGGQVGGPGALELEERMSPAPVKSAVSS